MTYIYSTSVAASEHTGSLSFVVWLDAPAAGEVRVTYKTVAGTAIYSPLASADLVYQTGTLTFAPGQTSKIVTVDLVDNLVAESTEVFWLDLYSPVNAQVAQRYTPALVFDEDGASGTPAIRVSDVVVDETGRTANFFVWLDRPSTSPVTVSYATADDTAVAGQDFTAASGTLSFAPGEMVKTVSVDIADDALAEADEAFRLVLSDPISATLADDLGVATIGRSDTPVVNTPYINATAVAAGEGDNQVSFVVQLSSPSANEVRVTYQTDAGAAIHSPAGSADFQYQVATLYFAPGETTKVVSVNLVDDLVAESTEVFWLDLYSPVSAQVGQRYTPALIFDDDAIPGTPGISVSDLVVDESAQRASFFVSLDRPATGTVTVSYATADDTAVAGQDFTAVSGTLSFAPGEMVKTVSVDIADDALAEADEAFRLVLSDPISATLADDLGVATIGRSDTPVVNTPYINATAVAAGEGDNQVSFVVQLSSPSANEVRVSYQLDPGTAIYSPAGSADFQYQTATLYFAPGETTKVLSVNLVDDLVSESTELFWLDLYSPVNAQVGQRYTPALIFDDDAIPGTPGISVSDLVVDESAQRASFFVSLDRPATGTVTVSYATADDTAVAGQDFTAASGTLSFAPGEMVKTVSVDIADDALAEADEAFRLVLSDPISATLADDLGVATIGRSDTPVVNTPYISATAVAAGEGDNQVSFVVQLSSPSANEVRVTYQTDAGTAIHSPAASADYQYQVGTLYFAPGETTKVVSVNLVDNLVVESTELFWLDLYSPVNAQVGQRYTPGLIFDDDATLGTPGISVSDVVVDESAQRASFFVSLDRPSSGTVTVEYSTADDGAVAGQDFTAVSGTLSFAPGEMVKTVSVDITDDALAEPDESFRLVLSDPISATLADGLGVATIGRSDEPLVNTPYINTTAVAASEEDGQVSFVVRLSSPSANEVRVNYQTDAGTAIHSPSASADYQYQTGTLYFAPGETTKVVTVSLLDDLVAESTEVFWFDLNSPLNAQVGQRYTPGLIFDDDATLGTPGISVSDVVVDESAQRASFFVSLDRPATGTVTIAYESVDGSAHAGSDYRAVDGVLSFAPGETLKTVMIDIVDDSVSEDVEHFHLLLSDPTGATVTDGAGKALIGRSDLQLAALPQILARPVLASEADTFATFIVELSEPSANAVRVSYQSYPDSAIHSPSASADYQYQTGTLYFAPGETTKLVPITLIDDSAAEGQEAFSLYLYSALNATVAQTYTDATIIDDDSGFRVLSHGISDDAYLVTAASDFLVEVADGGIDTILTELDNYVLPEHIENLTLLGALNLNGTGNALDNVLTGNNGNNRLDGTTGWDAVDYSAASGPVTVNLGSGAATGGGGNDTLVSIENAYGSNFADLIVGDTGPNRLAGRAGNDTIDGGAGVDTALLERDSADYTLGFPGGQLVVTDTTGDDGTDTLSNVEWLQFADKTVIVETRDHGPYADVPEALWHFFIVAFNAAPGVEYMDQLAEAHRYGLTVKQIVDIFTTKHQFTDVYPLSLSNHALAQELVAQIVKGSASDAAKLEAINDIEGALGIGWTRGDVIYTVFGNLGAKPFDDPTWGGTARQFANEITVAKYYTEVLNQSTTDLQTLRDVLYPVNESTDVSTPEVIATLIGVALMDG